MSTKRLFLTALFFVLAVALASPAWAQATGRGGGTPPPAQGGGGAAPPPAGRGGGAPPAQVVPRVTVGVGVGWGYGYGRGYGYGPWGPYGAWGYGYGPWGPYGPWGGWGGPWGCCYYDYMYASARIEMQPKEAKAAEVFVDGYKAGIVEDFDGTFQRLNLWPGEHQITLFLEGYATQNHLVYMAQGTTTKIKGAMEKLPAGVKSEPPPQPAPPDEQQQPQYGQQPRSQQGQQQPPQTQMTVQQAPVQFGAMSIKVLPDDAVIAIDNQIWTGPTGDQRLNVQVASGRHHVEVRKDGFVTYAEDVLIRPGATLTLNVNLSKK